MNLKELREIIKLMNDNELSEVELEHEGTKIKLKKASSSAPEAAVTIPTTQYQPVLPQQSVQGQTEGPSKSANRKEITSPMVGTFYRAPSPDSPPYVEVGEVVEVGQVVCIIEAMKLMNEIKSEIKGKIVEIPVENAHPVEYGQTLFVLEPV